MSQADGIATTPRRVGRRRACYASVTSTMTIAHELAAQGAVDGTVILADEQTAGRGRGGRSWHAPRGSAILCSLILRPPLAAKRLFLLTAAVAVGLRQGIHDATGLTPALKWPNDLLLNGGKLAGVLCETRFAGPTLAYAVVGFGLNLALPASAVPTDSIGLPPISLSDALPDPPEREALLECLLAAIDRSYDLLWRGEEEQLLSSWRAALAGIGERVRVQTDEGAVTGIFAGVDPDGALVLERAGQRQRLLAGDVLLGPRPLPDLARDRARDGAP